ncbi:hypothetical protein SAMN05192573_10558 [Mucilaginibacter gossypii]|jgi:hypothetical protein|uniref:Uncharacterized protein n=1 Tax=Mucilaginibacter gossypii TaxID=551996 RepID=A0A1G7XGW3_9SPHI|nr:hypothetical protein SAMN05192573_10558 [Mucilaginibacter gossypii]
MLFELISDISENIFKFRKFYNSENSDHHGII